MNRIIIWLHYPPMMMLIVAALLLGSMPLVPEPHLFQKINMLMAGTMVKPVDIFDLVWHSWPVLWIVLRIFTLPLVDKGVPIDS
ncbi:hypothetical protein D8Y20_02865 [Mariprofundus sp. EBB-1]|uniref:hypothetical protein n=1 Tax=Mariprofundus sp. EBB-1 TaxID=2650971 RepID=UPI000EF1EB9B|nr:hypothetical protein [Mariprofundus sp. EBB-1]RLL54738.1 hypothetical protein D8Y20_02865 [Mariprofundus sp. EBB-1]